MTTAQTYKTAYKQLKKELAKYSDFYDQNVKYCGINKKIIEYSGTSPFVQNGDFLQLPPQLAENKKEVSCMWDTYPIDISHIVFLPDKFMNNIYHCSKFFCSLNCAIAYLLDHPSTYTGEKITLLRSLYDIPPSQKIMPSPGIHILEKYGGDLDIETYRQRSICRVDCYLREINPVIAFKSPIIEERKIFD